MFDVKPTKLNAEEVVYLRGVEAITRAPISAASHWLIISFFLLIVVILMWAILFKIDIVSSAQGKSIPSSRIQLIQAPQLAVVDSINVKEGDRVTKGQLLVKLGKGVLSSEQRDAQARVRQLEARVLRLSALMKATQNNLAPSYQVVPETNEQKLEMELMNNSWAMYGSELNSTVAQKVGRSASVKRIEADMDRLQKLIPLSRRSYLRNQRFYKKGGMSINDLEQSKEVLIDRESSLQVLKQQLLEAKADLLQSEYDAEVFTERFINDLSIQLVEAKQLLASTKEEVIRAGVQADQFKLIAPMSGIVKNIAVNTVGGVVQPAETLMQIVPENVPLEVKAKILNRDIGFVRKGQRVKVKIDTFNFTKYGVISGTIKQLALDATDDEKLGPVYLALIELDHDAIQIGERKAKLVPGMTMIVDIHVGQRRLIEYVLNPVLRYKNEVMRER